MQILYNGFKNKKMYNGPRFIILPTMKAKAIVPFICDLALILLDVAFRNRLNVLGINIFCFDLFITLFFGIYLYFTNIGKR